jgi:hypothetical protein
MDIEWCIYIIGTYIWQWQPDVVVDDTCSYPGMKTVRIFSDRIRDRIRLEGF